MNGPRKVMVAGTGAYVPERVLSNADLEKMVDTSDEWIVQRTGMRERRLMPENETNSDLGARACMKALEAGGSTPDQVDLIIVATITPDHFFPATACMIQHKIGAVKAGGFDLAAACTGFIYGMTMAWNHIAVGAADQVLVVGSEAMSRVVDYQDRNTCVLFGDGAGAVLLKAGMDGNGGHILHSVLRAYGQDADLMMIPAGGATLPPSHATIEARQHYVHLKGRQVFKTAVNHFADMIVDAMKALNVSSDEVGLVVPHQVNMRIVEAVAKKAEVPLEKIYTNLDRYGNTSGASIPLAFEEAVRTGRVVRGDLVILVAYGGGATWGTLVFRY